MNTIEKLKSDKGQLDWGVYPPNHLCGNPTSIEQNMFYWRGQRFSGIVCKKCNALYENPKDSFFDYVVKEQKATQGLRDEPEVKK